MLEAEMVILALEAMALGRLVDPRLVTALPGAVRHFGLRFRGVMARLDANAVEKLGFELHQA
jgi:hypothetical protein